MDKDTKRLRKDIEKKTVSKKQGKYDFGDDGELKKGTVRKQKHRKNITDELEDAYEEWEDFSF